MRSAAGYHSEWAFRIAAAKIPPSPTGAWKIYAVVCVEMIGGNRSDSIAFGAGVYDQGAKNYPADAKFHEREVGEKYRSYLVGTFKPGPERDIFLAPAGNPDVKAVWADRVFLVPAR
jgi:hypothetical protein